MTGLIMFIFITWGYPVVNYIPLSAVSGISVAMVCSFIQWRSMVATFTTCLPTAKRDKLPPQFNISRVDVLIMLLVTAATLIVDVATLLLFVLAVGIVVFTFLRNSRDARNQTTAEAEDDIENQDEFDNQDQSGKDAIPEAALNDDGSANDAYESRPWPTEDEASQVVSLGESVLDAAEKVIFPPRNTLS
jgi:MFS superfamily sulfate permease-like transporter